MSSSSSEPKEPKESKDKPREPKDYTTLLDLLVLDKECAPFLKKLAEARMTSILANKGLDKQNKRVIRYTVFVPKKGLTSLKGAELIKVLKTHIVKGNYSQEYVKKICEEKQLEALKLKTLSQYTIEVDCSKYVVKTLKGAAVTIKKKPNLEATNGVVYIIDEPLKLE